MVPNAVASHSDTNIVKTAMVGDVQRTYRVHVPQEVTTNAPLVFVLHGFLENGSYISWDTGFSKYADKKGFITVYPHGVGLSWNAGNCCGKSFRQKAQDIAFFKTMVKDLAAEYKINTRMVFAAGFSNGAMLCYRIAQELPDLFAAIASVQGSLRSLATPGRGPISVLIIHGDQDTVFPSAGGAGHWLFYKTETPSIDDTGKYWANNDECSKEPMIEDSVAFEKQTYSHGKDGTEVCLYKVKSTGHLWPGGREWKFFHRSMSSTFFATQAIIDFFLNHEKKPSAST